MLACTCFTGLTLSGTKIQHARADRRSAAAANLTRAVAGVMPRVEGLECRRMLSVAINGEVTLDESPGLQTTGIVLSGEDNNDSDVALGTLPASFSSRLFGAPAAGLGLSSTFATLVGAAKSEDNYISVSSVGTIVSLGFSKADGSALPVYAGVATGGVASGLSALTGGAISFFADASLGNRMVIGVDGDNQIALAMFMEPNATLTGAKVWTVQLEPLANPDATNFDDPVVAGGLGVAAGISTDFDFNTLPSGQNLFGVIGDPGTGLVIIGKNPVLHPDGTYTNASNTINTSQGGGGTTIGVNNQMFDPNEGAYFTFVKDPNPNFLGTDLSSTEADDADNIQYSGGTLEVDNGFLQVVQRQGSGALKMRLSAFNMAGAPQGTTFVSDVTGAKPAVNITEVKVNGVVVFSGSAASVEINIAAGATVSWKTDGLHDVVLVEGVSGKFDIGGFGTTQAIAEFAPLTGVRFEDDGPKIGPIASSIVDFIAGATITKTLNGVVGTDPNSATYTIDSFTTSITVNGVEVRGIASGNNTIVTYYADTSGDGTFGNAGDTAYYKLELNQTANSGAGSYTFTVLVSPPPAETAFDFNTLPSGQNLFGVIGDPGTGLVIIGKNPVLHPDGTYTNASNTINTSQGGGGTTIGVNNQMFDPNEGAYFTFVKDPNPNFLGTDLSSTEADDADNIQYSGGTLEVDNGFLQVVQRQGNGALKMRLSAFNMAGSPQGTTFVSDVTAAKPAVNITEVKVNGVVVFSGSAASVEINIAAGATVSWKTDGLHDVVLVEGVSGKFDIGGFGTTLANPTPDQKLDFVVRVIDGDSDFATSGFSIGIDGTGPNDDDLVAGVIV